MELYLDTDVILMGLPIAAVVIAIVAFLTWLTIRAHRQRVETGNEGIVGERGVYKGEGRVFVRGELWHVEDFDGLAAGDKVVVEQVDRMALRVRKL